MTSPSGPVSNYGGVYDASRLSSTAAATVTARIESDGTVRVSNHAGSTLASQTWYSPTTAGIGASYWVRATVTAGVAPSSGATGTWIQLTNGQSWTYSSGIGGARSVRYGVIRVDISSNEAGTNIVATGSFDLTATREF